ncbi:MAG: succinate dehydrogenase, cytochrome b556 subunit [Rhodospirillales bacterium]|nr:succinate dehydrogenase, cytochrome b556 subunit [Rhodospirillales bacterium]MCW8861221.1 succinate dehydrogenase, cytochrome b556 subunit [Rhodospirillales bacterium]MCW8952662.1 succinate dehydrogenase, cytochrome b556 subunit [Rhodospirillales bacterium]MCW8970399.1 succinate dehydrogenase, cytochrome b556 subunit [Rhodospirillales bacterium]MCW9002514.1 succinate dehydrogenase, cytochrome b556 subunit [Rhodospirillales bacterium]
MTTGKRPLSPHLQIYRPQITSILSITHRLTGLALAAGTLLLAYWLTAAAYGPDAFAVAQVFIGSWIGVLMMMGWTFALFYHLCNGVRHLLWDMGWGFELHQVRMSGLVVVFVSLTMTAFVWFAGFAAGG